MNQSKFKYSKLMDGAHRGRPSNMHQIMDGADTRGRPSNMHQSLGDSYPTSDSDDGSWEMNSAEQVVQSGEESDAVYDYTSEYEKALDIVDTTTETCEEETLDEGTKTVVQSKSPPSEATERAASVRSTSSTKLKQIVGSAVKETNTTTTSKYLVDPVVLLPQLKQVYTGHQDRIDVFLSFMSDEVEVCPHDNVKRLTNWGTPTNAEISTQLCVYAQKYGKASISRVKSWGKTTGSLFEAFASIVWPNRSKFVKTKRRCLYGIRLKQQDLGGSPSNTLQTSSHTPTFPRRVSLGSVSSQSSSEPKTLPPGIKNNRRRDKFTPYYDILENNQCYVIRVVLPLLDEADAQGITFDCNFAQKRLNISGSYIPGCHIGDQVRQRFGIHSPLLSVIHSPMHTTGWFDISIPLPTDVKDDEDALNIAHILWGMAIYLPRRKTTGTVAINFSSCFGSVNLTRESTAMTQPLDLQSDLMQGVTSLTSAQRTSKTTTRGKQSRRSGHNESEDESSTNDLLQGVTSLSSAQRTHKTTTGKEKKRQKPVQPRTNKHSAKKRKGISRVPSKTNDQETSNPDAPAHKRTKHRERESKVISQKPTKPRRLRHTTVTTTFTKDDLIGRQCTIAGVHFGKRYSHKRYKGRVVSCERRSDKDRKEYDYYKVGIEGDTNDHEMSLSDLMKFSIITETEYDDLDDEYQF